MLTSLLVGPSKVSSSYKKKLKELHASTAHIPSVFNTFQDHGRLVDTSPQAPYMTFRDLDPFLSHFSLGAVSVSLYLYQLLFLIIDYFFPSPCLSRVCHACPVSPEATTATILGLWLALNASHARLLVPLGFRTTDASTFWTYSSTPRRRLLLVSLLSDFRLIVY